MKTYEGLFLFDPGAAADMPAAETEIKRILDRADAEIVGISKWDERRLAYPVNKMKRGLYVLSYFRAPPEKIVDLDRDIRLSEPILRALVLKRDWDDKQIAEALSRTPAASRPAPRGDGERSGGKPAAGATGGKPAAGATGDKSAAGATGDKPAAGATGGKPAADAAPAKESPKTEATTGDAPAKAEAAPKPETATDAAAPATAVSQPDASPAAE